MKIKRQAKERRRGRGRVNIFGNAQCPRLCVFRSLRYIQAQLIDDSQGRTLLSVSDKDLKGNKTERAKETGKLLAKKAVAAKITEVVFDRAGCKYHGRVKALAEGAREGGLKF